ncbi:MAG: hypothetical protein JW940_25960 [Polyangiaceae bacterium]|nr:hypothetical protein [Polyangiaceae bacterium]
MTRWMCTAAVLLGTTWSGSALGDVVMPPPAHCPAGRVPTTSHRGPECALAPPKNCPPGYTGQIGGRCALYPCESDENCAAWQRCKEVQLCLEPHIVRSTCGALTPEAKSLIGAPCGPVEPYTRWDPKSICKKEGDCPAPAECRMSRLCFAKGYRVPPGPPLPGDVRATADAADASATNAATDSATEPSDSDASTTADRDDGDGAVAATQPAAADSAQPPPVDSAQPAPAGPGASVPTSSEHPGGCGRGCATGSSPRAAGALALMALLVAVRAARRR